MVGILTTMKNLNRLIYKTVDLIIWSPSSAEEGNMSAAGPGVQKVPRLSADYSHGAEGWASHRRVG